MAKVLKEPTAPYNPFYGCIIMLIAVLIFGGIVAWAWYSLVKQDTEIAKFAVDQPVALSAEKPDAAGISDLKQRLEAFSADAKAGKAATISLNIPELNALMDLAPDTGYGRFSDMIAFRRVNENDELIADVCFPMNKIKFWEGKRYAVGEAAFTTHLVKDAGPDMKLVSLKIPGKEVNPGFLEAFSGWHWLTPWHKLETLAPVMKAVQSIKVVRTGVEVSTRP